MAFTAPPSPASQHRIRVVHSPNPDSSGESPKEQDGVQVLSYFSVSWQHNFLMMSNNTHYDETGNEAHNGGTRNSWLGGSLLLWASLRSSQLSLQNWGYSEVIENNLRSMSVVNVYLGGNF